MKRKIDKTALDMQFAEIENPFDQYQIVEKSGKMLSYISPIHLYTKITINFIVINIVVSVYIMTFMARPFILRKHLLFSIPYTIVAY